MGKVWRWCALWLMVIAAPALAEEDPPLSLTVLGSGGPGAVGRASSGYLVSVDGTPRILVDAGPGTFARLGETGLSLAKTDIILLTHLHADHAGELPGLIKARAVAVRAPITFEVFGPQGHKARGEDAYFPATSRLIDQLFGAQGAFAYLTDFAGHITFKVKDLPSIPTMESKPVVIYSEGDLIIRAIPGHHRDASAVIYRIEHGGKSITFTGDIDAKGHQDLKTIAEGTSLLVFNSVVLDPPAAPPILYTLHTGPTEIGRIAQSAGAGRLLLSHLSPATDQNRDEVSTAIRRAYPGPITFAEDKEQITP